MPDNMLSREELKLRLIEIIRRDQKTQVMNIVYQIGHPLGRDNLTPIESQLLLELIHEFTVTNILMPAYDAYNTGWPWLSVTTHGREVLEKGGPPVYDYDGYLKDLKSRVPDLDSVVELYLGESLQTYQTNTYYASMAMLGCASERAIRLLIDAYVNAIDDATNRDKLKQRIEGRDISKAYERFRESFDSTRNQVNTADLVNDFDAHVEGVFNFIRLLRNSIMHPSAIPNITSAMVYAHLQEFSYYAETIFKLISYFQSNSITV
jgi:hypothetical protein